MYLGFPEKLRRNLMLDLQQPVHQLLDARHNPQPNSRSNSNSISVHAPMITLLADLGIGDICRSSNIPCLTETYLALEAATKLAWGRESSREKSSSFVTAVDLVFSTALDPIGAKYCPCTSRSAMYPPWYSTEKWQS